MSLTFERKLPIILFFVFLMLTTVGFLFYQSTVSIQQAIEWEKHTQEVLLKVDETNAASLEIQPAVVSFLYLGVDAYLDPLNRAKPKIVQNIGRLRQLTAENPAQVEALNQLESQLKNYVDEADKKIDIRKSGGPDAVMAEIPWQAGKELLDRIRLTSDEIKSVEIATLQAKEQWLDRRLAWTIWILIGSSIAGIISLGLANLVVLSEIKKRRVAQKDLIVANESLEKKVGLRTTELQEVNEKLKDIGSEREVILLNEKNARREAEIANRLRDEFMATVSHELRTPLNSILGWARLMRGGTLDHAQSEKAITTIIKNSETQNRLIEDLLDVARVISGKLQLDIVEIDAVEVVSNAVETVRPIAEAKHIKIDLDIEASNQSHPIKGDRNRLTQIFTNLLTNSIKFSSDGSPIFVSVGFEDGVVTTSIRDKGKGISPDFLPLVFERFRQDTTTASKNGGLGLGLAIVRNLVEIHGGSVRAESKGEDMGSTFTVTLPTAGKSGLVSEQKLDGLQKIDGDYVR
jgi:signal transduction histidine kinase